ncbi:MAG TPA: 2-isopropylmalate synthase [Cellvibrionaceae bacterium]|nr:2-isopropylmalate synthase [Cellvibrionaceae bacterium]HMW71010.1 2-isopropylmalate synthase [Cellvibrionaceae bacterium]HNG58973.1 2-isopropylmalate synthase [Cellvibrionaceae bacterium]
MLKNPAEKYRPFKGVALPDRTWPNRQITRAPIWMSTDLRDGNQALMDPMNVTTKLRFFKHLVAMGFKEIEIGFPSASQIDWDFARLLIEGKHIPQDVTIEVLTQARLDLIEKTVASVAGAKQVILHMYNPVAPAFRRIVYNTDQAGVKAIAEQGTRWVKEITARYPQTQWTYQYSPEVFSGTEIEFAKEVCDAVSAIWQPTPERKMIINLPATVEMGTPNTYADQIEWMHRYLDNRASIILSVHPHNDRGTAVAAAELAVMAGADRVEGCLFGNGERTGNVDLVTLAMNLYSQGIHPGLDFSNMDQVRQLVEECTQLPVHPRHPYAGELVFTAFSGSHQDAIKKGFAQQQPGSVWEVPYLPIDPQDVGKSYDAVVRVNSQSGKGGVSFLLQQEAGFNLPRRMQIEFSAIVQRVSDNTGREVKSSDIVALFEQEYFAQTKPFVYHYNEIKAVNASDDPVRVDIHGAFRQEAVVYSGTGNGPIDAAANALSQFTGQSIQVVDYHEHALTTGSQSQAVCYLEVKVGGDKAFFGVGVDKNIIAAAIKALFNGVNRKQKYSQAC